jgi:hypothetical protein
VRQDTINDIVCSLCDAEWDNGVKKKEKTMNNDDNYM